MCVMHEQDFISHVTSLRSIALQMGLQFFGNVEDAEDVAQETMMRLWASREHIDMTRPLKPLVVRVARNVCVDHHRNRRILLTEGIHALAEGQESADPQSLLEERENDVWLEHRLKALPEYLRRVLRMRQEDGLSNQQIADVLATDPHSVQTLISKARHQLLNDLKQRYRNEQ